MRRGAIHSFGATAVLLLLAGCGGRPGEKAYQQGISQLGKGDYKAAARSLKAASSRITTSAALYYNLGAACHRAGRNEAAVEAFQAALEINPSDVLAMEYLGRLHMQDQRWDEARLQLERALELPGSAIPRIRVALATIESNRQRPDIAHLHLTLALREAMVRTEKDYPPARYNLGVLCRDQFRLVPEAIQHFEIFLRSAPQGDPHVDKAAESLRRLKQQNVVRAAAGGGRQTDAFQRALREAEDARVGRQWSTAIAAYKRALAIDPLSYMAAYNLGFCLQSAGNSAEAAKAFRRAAEADPTRKEPFFMQASALRDSRELDAAAAVITTQLIPRWPGYIPAYDLMMRIRDQQKRYEEARRYGEYQLLLLPPSRGRDQIAAWLKSLP